MTDDAPMTLRQWVGREVRRLREQHGTRQDDLAASARELGLTWGRPKIAALERGDKALPAEELVLLPMVLALAGCGNPSLADLLPDGPGSVALTPHAVVPADLIGQVARGRSGTEVKLDPRRLDNPHMRAAIEAARMRHERSGLDWPRVYALWPRITLGQAHAAKREACRDAEQRAGHRLGVPPAVISVAAHQIWGRGLTEERDTRVASSRDHEARSVQAARGHITRALYRELAPAVNHWHNTSKQREES